MYMSGLHGKIDDCPKEMRDILRLLQNIGLEHKTINLLTKVAS